jgi:hypothetical protein
MKIVEAAATPNFDVHTDTTLPVFATDISNLGAKTFYTCGYSTFVFQHYSHLRNRHEYEVLRWDRPTKIFFDLDAHATSMPTDEFERRIDQVVDRVRAMCQYYLLIPSPEPYILTASTVDKHSAHIIFDVVLESMEQVKRFVLHGFSDMSEVDKSVYTRNRCFRLLGSTKKGRTAHLGFQHSTTALEPVDVFRTMVQAILPSSLEGPLAYDGRPQYVYTFESAQTDIIKSSSVAFHAPDELTSYIASLGGQLRSGREEDEQYTFIVQKMHCPFAKKVHKSNNMFLNINKTTMVGYMMCADPECPKLRIWTGNYLWTFAYKKMND